MKLNFDGSVLHSKDSAAGFVLRDRNGVPILGSAKKLGLSTVICAEASGLKAGLQAALLHGHKNLEVEGDSKVLVDSINDK